MFRNSSFADSMTYLLCSDCKVAVHQHDWNNAENTKSCTVQNLICVCFVLHVFQNQNGDIQESVKNITGNTEPKKIKDILF